MGEKHHLAVNCLSTEVGEVMKRKELFWLTFIGLLFVFMVAVNATAQDNINPRDEWQKGALVVGVTNSGSCVFKPFVKVADTNNDPDTDKPQILGYEPGNVVIKNGTVVYERAREETFIPLGHHKQVRGRLCSAPEYNE